MSVTQVVRDGKTWSRPSDIRFTLHHLVKTRGIDLEGILTIINVPERAEIHRRLFALTEQQAEALDIKCPRSIDLTSENFNGC